MTALVNPPVRGRWFQLTASVRAVFRVRVRVPGAVRAAGVRDGLAAPPASQTEARARRPAAPLLRAPQRVPQEEGRRTLLIPIRSRTFSKLLVG